MSRFVFAASVSVQCTEDHCTCRLPVPVLVDSAISWITQEQATMARILPKVTIGKTDMLGMPLCLLLLKNAKDATYQYCLQVGIHLTCLSHKLLSDTM